MDTNEPVGAELIRAICYPPFQQDDYGVLIAHWNHQRQQAFHAVQSAAQQSMQGGVFLANHVDTQIAELGLPSPCDHTVLEAEVARLLEENRKLRAEVSWLKADWPPYNWDGDSLPWSRSPH